MDETLWDVLNRDRFTAKDIEENEKVCDIHKTICEVTEGFLGKKVGTAARNISGKALRLTVRRRGLYKNYLSDRSDEKNGM